MHLSFHSTGVLTRKYRVTVVKDKDDRTKSTGVAFIMYVRKEDAVIAVKAKNGQLHNGRTLKVKVATDNGRSKEFIKKRVYNNKSKCFECGVCKLLPLIIYLHTYISHKLPIP